MRNRSLLLSIASGLLAWLGWPGSPLGYSFILFFAWIPLLLLAQNESSTRRFFLYCYLSMFCWNIGTTWWIWNATAPGAVAAWVANSLLFCLPWLGYHLLSKKINSWVALGLLVSGWMSFEFFHLQDWGLSWPWLTLGNGFANSPDKIQWYAYTGVAGGTCWILLVNIFLFLHIRVNQKQCGRKNYSWLIVAFAIAYLPIIFSYSLLKQPAKPTQPLQEVVIVQPNIDPYEKVTMGTEEKQLQTLVDLTAAAITPSTTLVLWPETALYNPYGYDEEKIDSNNRLVSVRNLLTSFPRTTLFSGIESYRWVNTTTPYSRFTSDGQAQFEAYNGGVLLDQFGTHGFYHKSKLVPGVETLPWFLRFIDNWFVKFGGVTAGYAKQSNRNVLIEKNGWKLAPAICYESIYGDFIRQYVKSGANLITIITNDGWWKNTPGHIQHFQYAKLRAIETGCWVARSANTGISGFINPKGTVIEYKGYGVAATLQQAIPLEKKTPTFYVAHGDWLYQFMVLATIILFAISLRTIFRRKV